MQETRGWLQNGNSWEEREEQGQCTKKDVAAEEEWGRNREVWRNLQLQLFLAPESYHSHTFVPFLFHFITVFAQFTVLRALVQCLMQATCANSLTRGNSIYKHIYWILWCLWIYGNRCVNADESGQYLRRHFRSRIWTAVVYMKLGNCYPYLMCAKMLCEKKPTSEQQDREIGTKLRGVSNGSPSVDELLKTVSFLGLKFNWFQVIRCIRV